MDEKEATERAKMTIEKILYITIATSDKNGKPWNTPIYSAYDKNYIFYWGTSPESRHSLNIKENSDVAIVIYDSTVPEGTGFGVYIEAKATMITDKEEATEALKLLYERKSKKPRPATDFLGDAPRRLYKAVTKKAWVNSVEDVRGHPVDVRVEISLK